MTLYAPKPVKGHDPTGRKKAEAAKTYDKDQKAIQVKSDSYAFKRDSSGGFKVIWD